MYLSCTINIFKKFYENLNEKEMKKEWKWKFMNENFPSKCIYNDIIYKKQRESPMSYLSMIHDKF